jgi:uncharacterized iron-regulated protein
MNVFTLIMAVMLLLAMSNGVQAGQAAYQIYTAGGQQVTDKALAGLINQYDVIIFGEYHDNAVLHTMESELLKNAFAQQPKLAVSLEMFERDVQRQLDDYLSGEISEQEFLGKSRPWKNYQAAYRPLVEFARGHSLPVIAANIPRSLAAQYAREGSLAAMPAGLAGYLPQVHLAPAGEYRQMFMAYMIDNMNTAKMPVSRDKLEDYYKAQCLKDDTMAESIAKYHQLRPDYKIIHYQGEFHSRERLGVVEKLQLLKPALKVAVIAPVYIENFAELPDLLTQYQNIGDIIIFLSREIDKE